MVQGGAPATARTAANLQPGLTFTSRRPGLVGCLWQAAPGRLREAEARLLQDGCSL